MARHDLTEWIIHFIHNRNPENDPLEFSYEIKDFEYIPHPDGFTYDGQPIFMTDKEEEDSYGLAPDDDAICVLQKILHDGYIRAGWSYRKFTPTVYGPKAAVCFTEMPLYALVEYAKTRNDTKFIERYGIAFLKHELFSAGARPVIYGLSGKHIESTNGDANFGIGLRTLSTKTGIGLREQYRYVHTNLKSDKRIDWTHEREWRWADLDENFDFPGLPVFAQNDRIEFSKIVVIVKTLVEVENVIEQLKNLYHSMSANYSREYNLSVIGNTHVLALEEVAKIAKNPNLVKLEDLPLHSIPRIQQIKVSNETLAQVKAAVERAFELSYAAIDEYAKRNGDTGLCGYVDVITWKSNSEITQALVNLRLANSYADGCYYLDDLKPYPIQSLDAKEVGAKVAVEYLRKELGEYFSYKSELD